MLVILREMKKILAIILILVLAAAGAYFYFNFFRNEKPKVMSPAIDAVPANAAFIIEWKGMSTFRSINSGNNDLITSLKASSLLDDEFNAFAFLDSTLNHDSLVSRALQTQPIFISAHLSGVKKFNFLFTTNLPDGLDSASVIRFFQERFKNTTISKRQYESTTVYELKQQDLPVFSYTIINSIFVGSRNTVLTEESIRHILHGKSLREDPGFKKIMETSKGRESGTAYINYRVFPSFAELFLTPSIAKQFRLSSQFANWSGADIKVKNDATLLTGYVFSNDTNNNYLNIFKGQKPQQMEFQEAVPSSVSFCYWTGLSDLKSYFRKYYSWLENSNRYFNTQNELKALNESRKTKFPEDLAGFCGKEFFYFTTEKQSTDSLTTGEFLALSVTDADKAISYFKKLRPDTKTDTLAVTINEQVITPVYLGSLMNLSGIVPFDVECQYIMISGNYLFFAETREDLAYLQRTVGAGNTLKKSMISTDINENLANEASVFMMSVPFRSKQMINDLFTSKEPEDLTTASKLMNNYSVVAMQVTTSKDLLYQDILVKYNPEAQKEQIPAWEQQLEDDMVFVQSVSQENDHGVFTMDAQNNLTYFDADGQQRFSKKLNGAVNGSIKALPLKSEVPVYVIPTSSGIYAMNINGIDQGGFPLLVKATYLNVFDYENQKEPRIIAGTEKGKILCYNAKGEISSTWNPELNEKLDAAPVYIRVGNKDYLAFATASSVTVTDRKGKIIKKFTTKGIVAKSLKPVKGKESAYLGFCDSAGDIWQIYPDKLTINKLRSGATARVNFFYEDLDRNKKKEFIICDTTGIKFMNDSSEVIREININGLKEVEILRSKTNNYILYKAAGETGLLDGAGYQVQGLPIHDGYLSADPSTTPASFYVVRGRNISKFAITGF
jgi:hypothetical protein